MSSVVRLVVSLGAILGFALPFALFASRGSEKAVQTAGASRWGIMLQGLGFWVVYLHPPAYWNSPIKPWRAAASLVFVVPCWWLAWTGPRHLGKQWRFQAALTADHELVQTGPYRIVRHPIYASMLCLILSGCFSSGVWPAWPIGLLLFILGMEIRVRAEDRLLLGRFGARFDKWKRETPAYLPFVR